MEITNLSLPWSTEDIDLWRQFLNTQTGQRLIPKLLENVPPLLTGGEVNAILIRNGEVRGYQESAQALLALTQYPPPPQQSPVNNYPDPMNDAAWNDGEKVSEQQKQ